MKESYPALPFLNIMHWYIHITRKKKKKKNVRRTYVLYTKQNGNTKLGMIYTLHFYV